MRIVIVAVGSRGDVQPCVALALGLDQAGFEVRLAAPARFRGLGAEHGVAFDSLPIDPSALLEGDVGRAWVESGRSPTAFRRGLLDMAEPMWERLADAILEACMDADAVVYTTLGSTAWHVAQAHKVPAIQATFSPVNPTAAFPPMLLASAFKGIDPWQRTPAGALARSYHRASHWLFAQMLWLPLRRWVNHWRRTRLDLPALGLTSPALQVAHDGEPLLCAFSPAVLRPPRDWGPNVVTTGYWFLPPAPGWRPPDRVAAFLAADPPPVSIGIGSMTGRRPAEFVAIAVDALRRTGQRGVLLSGWAHLGSGDIHATAADVDLLVADEVPHDWLLGRVSAAVHHGGAGTTGASLRAGAPTVIIPHFADQPLWGDRVHALGAGPAPIPRAQLTPARLAHAIAAAVHDERICTRAVAVSEAINAEDGVGRAVEHITSVLEAATEAGRTT